MFEEGEEDLRGIDGPRRILLVLLAGTCLILSIFEISQPFDAGFSLERRRRVRSVPRDE